MLNRPTKIIPAVDTTAVPAALFPEPLMQSVLLFFTHVSMSQSPPEHSHCAGHFDISHDPPLQEQEKSSLTHWGISQLPPSQSQSPTHLGISQLPPSHLQSSVHSLISQPPFEPLQVQSRLQPVRSHSLSPSLSQVQAVPKLEAHSANMKLSE